jgi:transposase
MNKSRSTPTDWPVIHADAAGLDIGAEEIWAAVPPARDPNPVRAFGTFTPDLQRLADWLQACQVKTVAMESTGVYWIPIFELLEARGLEVYLVNARHIKNVPGRKSDVQDCQWIQRLHSFGLLSASFRPEAEMVVLRAYLRQRAMLTRTGPAVGAGVEHRAAHILHMQKALQQMNVQLTQVLRNIVGLTGMAIIRDIVAGQRDPVRLAQHRDPRCHSSQEEIAQALTGHYRPEHVFALKQAVALYDAYTAQLVECDSALEQQYAALRPRFDPDDPDHPLGPDPKPNRHNQNAPDFNVRKPLFAMAGVDLVAVDGVDASTAQVVLTEIGTDMTRWPTEKHFCSWLGLAPHNDITGGKVIRSRTLKNHNRAAQALRLAARSVGRKECALGAFYRRMKARAGGAQAVTATAHKLARIIYHMLKQRQAYNPVSLEDYTQQQREREVKSLQRRAARLGFSLQPQPTGG